MKDLNSAQVFQNNNDDLAKLDQISNKIQVSLKEFCDGKDSHISAESTSRHRF